MGKIAIVLVTSTPATLDQENGCRKVLQWLDAKRVNYKVIDGAAAENEKVRNELFVISEMRGVYPTVFLMDEETETTEFIGIFETIESLIEDNDLPAAIVEEQKLLTFNKVFADAMNPAPRKKSSVAAPKESSE